MRYADNRQPANVGCAVLVLIVLGLVTLVATAAEPDWDPHHGVTHLIRTPWKHDGATRYPLPQEILTTLDALRYANATREDKTRPSMGNLFPAIVDTTKPRDPNSWRIIEGDRFTYEPLANGASRLFWSFNISDIPQWRLFVPETHNADGTLRFSETYAIFLDTFMRDSYQIFPRFGEVNYVSFGRVIKVDGSLKIKLGDDLTIDTTGHKLIVSDALVQVRGTTKYLKVQVGGKLHGLPLVPLE